MNESQITHVGSAKTKFLEATTTHKEPVITIHTTGVFTGNVQGKSMVPSLIQLKNICNSNEADNAQITDSPIPSSCPLLLHRKEMWRILKLQRQKHRLLLTAAYAGSCPSIIYTVQERVWSSCGRIQDHSNTGRKRKHGCHAHSKVLTVAR